MSEEIPESQIEPRPTTKPAVAPDLTIVVPAYNEEDRLRSTLDRMLAYFDGRGKTFELFVVDDGSSDSTAQIAREIAGGRPEVTVLTYAGNRGKGYAVRYGILRAQGKRVLFSDADLATPIEEIEKLEAKLDAGYDVAIGSRDIKGAELVRRQSALRELGGKTFNKFVRMMVVPGIHDTQCGFKLFTRESARLVFGCCRVDHFAFDVEALFLAIKVFHYRVAEVPVRWAHQEGSKVRFFRDAIRMLKTVVRIRFTNYSRSGAPVKAETR